MRSRKVFLAILAGGVVLVFLLTTRKEEQAETDPGEHFEGPVKKCQVAGCSGELCLDKAEAEESGFSVCIFRPEARCYRLAECEVQKDGECGWTITQAARDCFNQVENQEGTR